MHSLGHDTFTSSCQSEGGLPGSQQDELGRSQSCYPHELYSQHGSTPVQYNAFASNVPPQHLAHDDCCSEIGQKTLTYDANGFALSGGRNYPCISTTAQFPLFTTSSYSSNQNNPSIDTSEYHAISTQRCLRRRSSSQVDTTAFSLSPLHAPDKVVVESSACFQRKEGATAVISSQSDHHSESTLNFGGGSQFQAENVSSLHNNNNNIGDDMHCMPTHMAESVLASCDKDPKDEIKVNLPIKINMPTNVHAAFLAPPEDSHISMMERVAISQKEAPDVSLNGSQGDDQGACFVEDFWCGNPSVELIEEKITHKILGCGDTRPSAAEEYPYFTGLTHKSRYGTTTLTNSTVPQTNDESSIIVVLVAPKIPTTLSPAEFVQFVAQSMSEPGFRSIDFVKVLHGSSPNAYPCLLFCEAARVCTLFSSINDRPFNPLESPSCSVFLVKGLTATIATNTRELKRGGGNVLCKVADENFSHHQNNMAHNKKSKRHRSSSINVSVDHSRRRQASGQQWKVEKSMSDNLTVKNQATSRCHQSVDLQTYPLKNGHARLALSESNRHIDQGCCDRSSTSSDVLSFGSSSKSQSCLFCEVTKIHRSKKIGHHTTTTCWRSEVLEPCHYCGSKQNGKQTDSQSDPGNLVEEFLRRRDCFEENSEKSHGSFSSELDEIQKDEDGPIELESSHYYSLVSEPQVCEMQRLMTTKSTDTQRTKNRQIEGQEIINVDLQQSVKETTELSNLLTPGFLLQRYECPVNCAVCLEIVSWKSSEVQWNRTIDGTLSVLRDQTNKACSNNNKNNIMIMNVPIDDLFLGVPINILCGHTFHSDCLLKWWDASCPVCRHQQYPNKSSCCDVCGERENLRICIICGFVGCYHEGEDFRHDEAEDAPDFLLQRGHLNSIMTSQQLGHSYQHYSDTHHIYALELVSLKVWDFLRHEFVHRLLQSDVDGKIIEVGTDASKSEKRKEVKFSEISSNFQHLLQNQLKHQKDCFEQKEVSIIQWFTEITIQTQLEIENRKHLILQGKKKLKELTLKDEEAMKEVTTLKQSLEDAKNKFNKLEQLREKLCKEQLEKSLPSKDEKLIDELKIKEKMNTITSLKAQIHDLQFHLQSRQQLAAEGDGKVIIGERPQAKKRRYPRR